MTEFETRVRAVADALRGTCESIERYTTLEERNSAEFCAALDAIVFECAACGWWCGVEEQHNHSHGFACDECHADETVT